MNLGARSPKGGGGGGGGAGHQGNLKKDWLQILSTNTGLKVQKGQVEVFEASRMWIDTQGVICKDATRDHQWLDPGPLEGGRGYSPETKDLASHSSPGFQGKPLEL